MSPKRYTAHPAPQDPLSSLVRVHLARLQGVVRIDLPSRTTLRIPAPPGACLHVVARGQVRLQQAGATRTLTRGHVAVVSRGYPHRLTTGSRHTTPVVWDLPPGLHEASRQPRVVHLAATSAVATVICAPITPANGERSPLLDLLPSTVVLDDPDPDLGTTAQMLAAACVRRGPGDTALCGALAEVALLRVLQYHFTAAHPSILGLLHDARLLRAITALHADLSRPWTVRELSKVAGMSESLFRSRLRSAVGEPWRSYVQRVRIRHAERLLSMPDAAVAPVAAAVGYQSESSFSRAFLTLSGVRPGQFILQHGPNRRP